MLYLTTRTEGDAFTCHRAMTEALGPDGGQYLPRSFPVFDTAALEETAKRSFNENVAHILNLLYRGKVTAWDVDRALGRRPLALREINSRTLTAEIWRGSKCVFGELVKRLFRLLGPEPGTEPGPWFTMSVRIAMLFGIFGQLMARGLASAETPVDLSVPSDDFQFPMAAVYARGWGLPIGRIIICCNENNAPWTLLHQGQLRPDGQLRATCIPACDQSVPAGLERLIHHTLGPDETKRYLAALEAGKTYQPGRDRLEKLREGLYVSVVSQRRVEFMLPNLCRAGDWMPDPYTAMAYAGLVDFRARTGATGRGLIISEESPLHHTDTLARILGESADALRRRLEAY